jgi:quercetin dioxygenase-like cupin family protein
MTSAHNFHWIAAAISLTILVSPLPGKRMSQIVNSADLSNYYALTGREYADAADSARIDMRMAFGVSVSLGVATCAPGYHPAPQIHASEQINYVAQGELWMFVDGAAYHLKEGDAIRVPKMKPHWMWNRSNAPCTFYESNCPPLAGDAGVASSRGALFDDAQAQAGAYPRVVWLAEKYAHEVEAKDDAPVEGPLLARAESLVTSVHGGAIGLAAAGKLTSKCIHGLEHNMTIARRKGGYHSVPHIHDAEQIHFSVKGDINIFTTDFGFACKEGDFNIVPPNIPHWAEVTSEDDNILLQAHSPVLGSAANRKALLMEEERALAIPTVFNMTPWREQEIMKVEAEHLTRMRQS